jgi:hypothetical protein
MAGFFKMWAVSGLTTEGAKNSEAFNTLGQLIDDKNFFESLNESDLKKISFLAKQVLLMNDSFESYFHLGNKKYHDDAVKFLVMLAAIMQGADQKRWDWEEVRHFSQGMYGSMVDNKNIFERQNIPIIESLMIQVRLISKK